MKLYTNRIFTGQAKTLDAFIKESAAKKQIKTASVKTAEENKTDKADKDCEMHVKMQPGDPCCGTDTGEIIEGDEKIKASTETEVKVAEKDEAEGVKHEIDPVGGTNTAKDESKVYPDKKAETQAAAAKVASQGKKADAAAPVGVKGDYSKIPNSSGRTHGPDECCGAPSSKGKDGSEGEKKEANSETQTKQGFEGVDWSKLKALANFKGSDKSKFKDYWRNLYGEEYAEAMAQDR